MIINLFISSLFVFSKLLKHSTDELIRSSDCEVELRVNDGETLSAVSQHLPHLRELIHQEIKLGETHLLSCYVDA